MTSKISKIWEVKDVWLTVILYFLLAKVFSSNFYYLASFFPTGTKNNFIGFQFTILILSISALILIFRNGSFKLSDVLIQKKDLPVLGICFLIVFISSEIFNKPDDFVSPLYRNFKSLPNPQFSISLVEVVLIGPFLEELIYRKYLLEILRKNFSISISILLVCLIETSFHFDYNVLERIYVFFFSIISSIIYLRTRLGVSWCFHSMHNGLDLLIKFGPFYPFK